MSNFKVGKSRFSRFINGKGFYIALALCLVAIGAAAYIAANNSFGNIANISGESSTGTNSSTNSGVNWNNESEAQTTGNTVSGVPANTPSSAASSSVTSSASTPSTSSSSSKTTTTSSLTVPTIYIMPVEGNILTSYSNDKLVYDKTMDDYRIHDGIDIAANQGTPVKACADGIVLDVTTDDMYGQTVTVQHGGGIVSIYSDLTTAVSVKKGQSVEAGDVIGAVGQTAKCEIALVPHLHFAMMKDNQYVDPLATMGKK